MHQLLHLGDINQAVSMFTRTLQTAAGNMLSSTRRTKPVHVRRDQTINETPCMVGL